ncbi:Type IV secretion system protein VirB11 [Paraburkholderia ultramafica]|uniref:Type IV secretion system protein VirB11 n=1 Tax=Paraburkholderia ultramafica TaxID=1544867 RepID=A0A6S7BY50_9BURK|nr:ATPase, T2SS/T4P/T4SS family [Paraburkholderia ultramafica]CAB3802690.1 Type IV secretion system protein VirB11 [Paraburkholderia ultramafica]
MSTALNEVIGFKAKSIEQLIRPLRRWLDDDAVMEIRVKPGEVVAQAFGRSEFFPVPELTFGYLRSLGTALVSYAGLGLQSVNYVTLPWGQRGTVLLPPAVLEGAIMIVIRKHSPVVKTLVELEAEGAFAKCRDVSFNRPTEADAATESTRSDFGRLEPFEVELLSLKREGRWSEFLQRAVELKRNIVIAGKTGSGKTTLARSLIEVVPADEHIATIEDVHELFLPNHKEVTHLFYGEGAVRISALACLAACMRITPERIFLAELRGAEAWEYTNSLNTDHGGGITTTHANGAVEAFDRIATLIKNSEIGRTLEMVTIRHVLYTTIDVVLFMRDRKILQLFYDPVFKRSEMR